MPILSYQRRLPTPSLSSPIRSPFTRNRSAPEKPDPAISGMEAKRRVARTLVARLSSVSEQTRGEALGELRRISKEDDESRPLIADAGAVPFLAETLYCATGESQDNAAATLLNLSISSRDAVISTRGLLDAVAHSLSHHRSTSSASAVQSCAATVHSLLAAVDNYRSVVGSKRDIIYALIDIVKNPNSPTRSIKDSLKALFAISLHQPNRAAVVELGAAPPLFSLVLKDGRAGIVEDATAVIAQIAGCEESEEPFLRVSGIGVLADLLDPATGSSGRVKENAVSALLNLARCGGEDSAAAFREMGVAAVDGIADVAAKGSAKGKSKAVALLKLLDDGGTNVFRESRFD